MAVLLLSRLSEQMKRVLHNEESAVGSWRLRICVRVRKYKERLPIPCAMSVTVVCCYSPHGSVSTSLPV
jgi:hypothetical protein